MDAMTYKTLQSEASSEFLIKKSKFIGYGSPAQTEEEALAFLQRIRQQHRDASHNCYAYVIGKNSGIMRYSDDGEPSGTAGMPIVDVIRARGVVNCCVVVTRYFGGILLGAGGLVRAYAQGAKTALDAANVITMERSLRFWAGMPYADWERVAHYLKDAPVITEDVEYGVTVTATLIVRAKDIGAVYANITQMTDARADLMELESFFYGW